jgi:hypothetical protein
MMRFKFFVSALLISWALTTSALAQGYIFDSPDFWSQFPVNSGARQAWMNGVKWPSTPMDAGSFSSVVYYDNILFGFIERKLPFESDPDVMARIKKSYMDRAEAQAIHIAGLFAFNNFDCTAKANFESIKPNMDECSTIKIDNKLSSEWNNKVFSIVQLSIDDICSCWKALEKSEGIDNYNIFFAPIARYEIEDLNKNNRQEELINFFVKHYKKNIFNHKHFLMVSDSLNKQKKYDDTSILLDYVTKFYFNTLNSEEWEKCGDLYLELNNKENAINAYTNALGALDNE